ncbi:MAG: LPS export ABC transporter permease LptF, partial [Legionellaceae bacterium]
MLIFRYLAKEVFITLVALTSVSLLIVMSNQFVQYLTRAANGQIPGIFILKLMMLELPNLMGLLLPLGFYLAILLAYGRLYADSEMSVLHACGYGARQLMKHTLGMAGVLAGVVLVIMLWLSPYISTERAKLLRTTGVQILIKTIVPAHFNSVSHGRDVFYVQSMNRDHTQAHDVFLARLVQKNNQQTWDVLWAEKAYATTDPATDEDYVVFEKGKVYEGFPGQADYRVIQFDQYESRLPHPVTTLKKEDLRVASTASLWPINNPDPLKAAEIQWRLSIPLMVIVLSLVAVPLSRVNPRSGKYAKLLPAMILYVVYANFIFIARNWVVVGKVPPWFGLWW